MDDGQAARAGKAVIDQLLKVRRNLTPDQELIALPKLNNCIEEIRSLIRYTDTQRIELIMHAVERQGATTAIEIAEDTRIHISVVRTLLSELYDSKQLYMALKTVIGSGRQNYIIKSNRVKLPEAEG